MFSYRNLEQVFPIIFNLSYASLILYDGNSNTAPLLIQYCFESNPPDGYPYSHISSSNAIFVHYQGDHIGWSPYFFKLEYQQYSKKCHNEFGKKECSVILKY